MTGQRPAVSVEGARKVYRGMGGGGRVAVDDVSIHVAQGTIHGLLGPNGAGKTTTLKMLLGLVAPTGGTFEILGLAARDPRARDRLGFLPEQPYFSPQLTAGQAMALYGRLVGLGPPAIRKQTAELLEKVGLAGKQRVQLRKFSRGMLQRLGLAQALLGEPEVIVLDEPASGLDPMGQRDVRGLMLELRSRGSTVLLSSHQLSEVEAVCDRVTILSRGTVAAEGHIDGLLNVAGRTSIRARGLGECLPEQLVNLVEDVAVSGGVWVFSVEDDAVRAAVDAIDDVGGSIESVAPKRESLEDYFAGLLASGEGGGS